MSETMTNSQLIIPEGIPRKRKVVIVGSSVHTVDKINDFYGKPDWEIWGMNQLYKLLGQPIMNNATRWFQIHHDHVSKRFDPFQWEFFKAFKIPIYMLERDSEIPYSIPYPIKEIMREGYHEQYFSNIISYMLALAIYESMEEIYIVGCDMGYNEEYVLQRPGVEFFIGYAKGKGIKVGMPPGSALLKTRLYGYESNDNAEKYCKHHLEFHEGQLRKVLKMKENKFAALWRMKGAKKAAVELNAPPDKIEYLNAEIKRLKQSFNSISAQEREGIGFVKAFSVIQQVFYGKQVWDDTILNLEPTELEEIYDE